MSGCGYNPHCSVVSGQFDNYDDIRDDGIPISPFQPNNSGRFAPPEYISAPGSDIASPSDTRQSEATLTQPAAVSNSGYGGHGPSGSNTLAAGRESVLHEAQFAIDDYIRRQRNFLSISEKVSQFPARARALSRVKLYENLRASDVDPQATAVAMLMRDFRHELPDETSAVRLGWSSFPSVAFDDQNHAYSFVDGTLTSFKALTNNQFPRESPFCKSLDARSKEAETTASQKLYVAWVDGEPARKAARKATRKAEGFGTGLTGSNEAVPSAFTGTGYPDTSQPMDKASNSGFVPSAVPYDPFYDPCSPPSAPYDPNAHGTADSESGIFGSTQSRHGGVRRNRPWP